MKADHSNERVVLTLAYSNPYIICNLCCSYLLIIVTNTCFTPIID